ncbi:MAG: glycosyltransferase family 4 protein [Planctomycetaceae bacterium]|nr:glycosyltransferase family 4 protein [Planctomycetaceae bacterium]
MTILTDLLERSVDDRERALLLSDRAVVFAGRGDEFQARADLELALQLDGECGPARENLLVLQTHCDRTELPESEQRSAARPTRIAFLSLLFNWPSTGGGTVHTYEATSFLQRAGYDVCHIFARFSGTAPGLGGDAGRFPWSVGRVAVDLPVPAIPVEFESEDWNERIIQRRLRDAVDRFDPDYVVITSSWNTQSLLAEAVAGYPYLLRFAALEGICPLNNVRLLIDDRGQVVQCVSDQLSAPDRCRQCVAANGRLSGGLHRAERALGGFKRPDYGLRLRRTLRNAHAVLAVNPQIADLLAPHASHVRVVPSGFDPDRFPQQYIPPPDSTDRRLRILFAGLTEEFMKGFQVLQAAGEQLWQRRKDFEIIVTADPAGRINEYTRAIGWQSQTDLPDVIVNADLLAFPTVAQEALGRSAVEAMGCGRPVVASRLGGLNWVVEHGRTGLLFAPGDVAGLARQIERLLDDSDLREQLGRAARAKFVREFTWDVILTREYFPIFGRPLHMEATR